MDPQIMSACPVNDQEVLERQRVLAEFGEFALAEDNLDDVLTEACRLLGRALRTDLAKVMELSPDGKAMVVRAGVGWRPGIVGATTVHVTASSSEGLTLAQGAAISPSIETETRFPYHAFMRDHGVQAFVNVLISSPKGRRPFGVLEVDSRSPREFQPTNIDFLRLDANLLGAAVERLRTVNALRAAIVEKKNLLDELDHRVKNMLATVQSVVTQTLRQAQTIDQARTDMEGRLNAMAKVHKLLSHQRSEAVAVRDLVSVVLEPYRGRGENRIIVSGDDVRVSPRQALALSMMFHELATNAIEYGALSSHDGIVMVDWTNEAELLNLRWKESGGPSVQLPSRRGFGSRLIERSLAHDIGGHVQLEYAPEGLVCTVQAPLG